MKKKMTTMAFILAMTIFMPLTPVMAASTNITLTKEYDTPSDEAIFTDVYINGERMIKVADHEGRERISGSANAKIDAWDSTINYVYAAPEIIIYFDGTAAFETSFEIKLTNLAWFFRNTETEGSRRYTNSDYSGGIEKLLPVSYNKYKGTFEPNRSSNGGGIYRRENDDEVDYIMEISDDDHSRATVTLTESADVNSVLRIPLVTRLLYYADANVEIISDSSSISSGVFRFLTTNHKTSQAIVPTATRTIVPEPKGGMAEINIPEIVISENLYATLDNGSFMLSAPKGFIIVPDTEIDIEKIDKNTLNIQDHEGNYVVDVQLNGGINWKNLRGTSYQHQPVRDSDFKITYRNPSGVIDPTKLILEFRNMIKSQYRNTGSISIMGLKLVAVEDVEPGDVYMEISQFTGIKNLTEEEFMAGAIIVAGADKEHIEAFNIETMTIGELIKTPEFKAKSFIEPFAGGLQPGAEVTRGFLCQMIYNLLADTDKKYDHDFNDIWGKYKDAIAFCADKGFISGYGDSKFLPDGYVTRGQFAVVLNNILMLNEEINTEFIDKDQDHFAYEALQQLVNAGIMQGYGNNDLAPNKTITKQEAVAMLNRAFGRGTQFSQRGKVYVDLPEDLWSYGYMMNAANGYEKGVY